MPIARTIVFNKAIADALNRGRPLQSFSVGQGWKVREDGDIEMENGDVILLEDFIEAERMDRIQAEAVLDVKARWNRKADTSSKEKSEGVHP